MKKFVIMFLLTIFFIFMIENWGALQKSATDDETIEQAIDRLIAVHEADAEAHQGAGESLQNHKSDTVIDHPAESVVNDKIPDRGVTPNQLIYTKDYIDINFETLDMWTEVGAGALYHNLGGIQLATTSSSNNVKELYAPGDPFGLNFALKNPVFEAVAIFYDSVNATYYTGIGDSVSSPSQFVGFKVVNGAVKGCVIYNGSETLTSDLSITPLNRYRNYRAEVISGESVNFYVDNVLVGTISIDMADAEEVLALFDFYVKTTSNDVRVLGVKHCLLYQDL